MSKSRKRKLSAPALAGQSKTLITEFPGRAALLLPTGRPMRFANAAAALAWCEENGASFYCLQPDRAGRN